MKTLFLMLAGATLLSTSWATEPMSVEEFKQIKDATKRMEIIMQTPEGQRAELSKIHHHLVLVERAGGEAAFMIKCEIADAARRGLAGPVALLAAQDGVWDFYIGAVVEANQHALMLPSQRIKIRHDLDSQLEALRKRRPLVWEQVFSLASTPQALELSKKAQAMYDALEARLSHVATAPITEEERKQVDKAVDAILLELGKLPRLTPEQIQKERDAITEDVRGPAN